MQGSESKTKFIGIELCRPQEKLNIYPYVNGITHTNGGRLINVHERIAIVT